MIAATTPLILRIGSLELPVSLLLILAGVAAAAAAARAGARRRGLSVRRTADGLFLMIVAGLVAGHLADVLIYRWDAARTDWRMILPASGGVCSLGAVLGAALAGAIWFRRVDGRPRSMLAYGDNIVLALSLGWGIGRAGCFVDHDHLGRLTTFFLGVNMPGGARHDLGLYESALALFIFAVLSRFDRRRAPPGAGVILGAAALLYGAGRFAIEYLRAQDLAALGRRSDGRILGLTVVQYAALALFATGLALLRAAQKWSDSIGPGASAWNGIVHVSEGSPSLCRRVKLNDSVASVASIRPEIRDAT